MTARASDPRATVLVDLRCGRCNKMVGYVTHGPDTAPGVVEVVAVSDVVPFDWSKDDPKFRALTRSGVAVTVDQLAVAVDLPPLRCRHHGPQVVDPVDLAGQTRIALTTGQHRVTRSTVLA